MIKSPDSIVEVIESKVENPDSLRGLDITWVIFDEEEMINSSRN